MKLSDFTQSDEFNDLKAKMGVPKDRFGSFATPLGDPKPERAYVLLQSGGRIDLLDPDPSSWTNEDLAISLSRTYRWGGHSHPRWDLPLSVAQHSLLVLALRRRSGRLTAKEALRELCHDGTEGLVGGFDCIAPLKPHLGPQFKALDDRLQHAVNTRYQLPAWSVESYRAHKDADRLAAACEALHVVGWSFGEMRDILNLAIAPLRDDPLPVPAGMLPWQPWPPKLAAHLFLTELEALLHQSEREARLKTLADCFAQLPANLRACCKRPPTGDPGKDVLVFAEAGGGYQSIEGVVVDGDLDGEDIVLDDHFTLFFINDDHKGQLLVCNGANCNVEIL